MEKLVNKTTDLLSRHHGCDPGTLEYDKLWYGINVFYLNVPKTVGLLLLAIWFKMINLVLVFALGYGVLRLFSFGIHLKSNLMCTLVGLLYYFGSSLIAKNIVFSSTFIWLSLIACFIAFLIFSPAATKSRPIYPAQRKKYKYRSLIALIVVAVSILFIQTPPLRNVLVMAMICQTLNILPFTYRIWGEEV